MSFNFNFGGMPNIDLGNIQVPDFSPQDYNFDGGIGQFGREAETKRQEANEARNSASNQYEADVADFKDREATEAEDTLNNIINEAGIGGLQDWNWEGEPGFTPSDLGFQGNTGTRFRGLYDPVDNWGEPGYEIYDPADEIIDPIEDFVEPEVSPFVDTNPFNDIWEAPVAEVTDNVGAGAGGDPRTDFAPINNPFEPVVVDEYPGLDIIDPVDPVVDIPGFGNVGDPGPVPSVDYPIYGGGQIDDGSGGGYEEENGGGYGNGEENGGGTPPAPPPPPPPPPPPVAMGPTAGPMNRLIAMQTGMFGGQPQGQYRPYEEPSATTYLNQPAPFPVMHGNSGGSIRQPTRNLKKLFSNPLDKGLGQLPVMGQNDTLTQTVQAGFRPRR